MKTGISTPLLATLIAVSYAEELRSQSCIEIECPTNLTVECESPSGTVVNYTVNATNHCATNLTLTCVPPPGSVFPLGATAVVCTGTDLAGHTNSCSFTVTVEDTTPPQVVCPSDLVINATSSAGAGVGFSVIATDACDTNVTVISLPGSGSLFPIGTTPVTCTATDDQGNQAQCAFTVTVNPPAPPSFKVTIANPDIYTAQFFIAPGRQAAWWVEGADAPGGEIYWTPKAAIQLDISSFPANGFTWPTDPDALRQTFIQADFDPSTSSELVWLTYDPRRAQWNEGNSSLSSLSHVLADSASPRLELPVTSPNTSSASLLYTDETNFPRGLAQGWSLEVEPLRTVVFQLPAGGYAGVEDTDLLEQSPDLFSGEATDVEVGLAASQPPATMQGLLRFNDLIGSGPGQVPPKADVFFAQLTLFSSTPGANSAQAVSLHRMLRPWDEASTWNSMSGGVSADDSEALAAPDAQFIPDFPDPANNGTQSRTVDVTQSVQAWAGGATNLGWVLLATSNDAYAFDSSETSAPEHRPVLAVHYRAPAAVLAFGLPHRALGQATLTTNADSSLTVSNLSGTGLDGTWVELGEAEGWSATFVPTPLADEGDALRTGAIGWLDGNAVTLGTETLEVKNSALHLTVDYAALGLPGFALTVLDETGQVTGQETISNGVPVDLSTYLPAGCGSGPQLDGRLIDAEQSAWSLVWTGCPPDNRAVKRTFVIASPTPQSVRRLAAVELTGRGMGGFALSAASLRLFGQWHDALGQSSLEAQGDRLVADNLGANPADGLRVHWDSALPLPPPTLPVRNVELTYLEPGAGPGASLQFESSGVISRNGGPAENASFGTVAWQDTGAAVECAADASGLGAGGVRVRVFEGTSLAADYYRMNGEWLARAVEWPTTYGLAAAADAGVDEPPEQVFRWAAPVLVDLPAGQQILADRLTLQPDVTGVSSVSMTGTSLTLGSANSLTITSERINVPDLPLPPPRTYEDWALRQWPAGTPASITARDRDPDGDGIPNIKEYAYWLNPRVADFRGLPEVVFLDRDGKNQFALRMRMPPWARDLEFRFWGASSLTPPVNWVPLGVVPLWREGIPFPTDPGAAIVDVLIPDVLDDVHDLPHRFIRIDLGAPPPAAATGESLRIGFYNTQFLPWPAYLDIKDVPFFSRAAMCCDDIEDRARLIAERIRATGFDVVALAEVFLGSAKQDLVDALAGDYPYYVRSIHGGEGAWLDVTAGLEGARLCDYLLLSDLPMLFPGTTLDYWLSLWEAVASDSDPSVPGVCEVVEASGLAEHGVFQDSGLMLFSRYPFEPLPLEASSFRLPADQVKAFTNGVEFPDVAVTTFSDCGGFDCLSAKGAGWVRIRKPGSAYVHNVVFTHLNAGKTHPGVRSNQLDQIRLMLQTGLGDRLNSEYVWMLGDLNINGDVTLPEEDLPDEVGRDRARWRELFNTPGGFFTDILRDVWERQCNLPWLSPADTGGSEFRDRGLTGGIYRSGDAPDEQPSRLDYLFKNDPVNPPVNQPLAVQHMALAYGLKWGASAEHPYREVAFGEAGLVNLSDHYGIIADVNIREPHCQPSTALGNPPDHGALADMPAHVAMEIHQPGGMQWVRFDTPGTYTIPDPPGTHVQVYASTDLSSPVRPLPAETRTLVDPNGIYSGSIFDVLQTPLFIRVRGLDEAFTGTVDLVLRRHQGASPADARGLPPNVQSPYTESLPVGTVGASRIWYRLDTEPADSGRPQHLHFFVTPLSGPAGYRLAVFRDPASPSIADTAGVGPLEANLTEPGGERLYLVVTAPEPTTEVRYAVGWDTDLSVLHGHVPAHFSPDCEEGNFETFLLCANQSDAPDRILGINIQDDDDVELRVDIISTNSGEVLATPQPPVLIKHNWDSGKPWPRLERAGDDGAFPVIRFLPDEQAVVYLFEKDGLEPGLLEPFRRAGVPPPFTLLGLAPGTDVIMGTIDPLPREVFMRCPEAVVRLEGWDAVTGREHAVYELKFHLSHGLPPGDR